MRCLSVTLTFALCASALHTSQIVVGVFRPELNTTVEVVQLLAVNDMPEFNPTEIRVKPSPDSEFEVDFKCVDKRKNPHNDTDTQAWIGCCLPNQQLKGSEATGFNCCNEGEDFNGCSTARGYGCCTSGSMFNGSKCLRLEENPCSGPVVGPCPIGYIKINSHCVPPCPPEQELVNNECLVKCGPCESRIERDCYTPPCPKWGTLDTNTCTCVEPPVIDDGCPPVVQAGKCYTFAFENGHRLGYNSESGFYTASDESNVQQFGKFKVCVSEACTPDVKIDPWLGFNLQDIQSQADGSKRPGPRHWLDGASGGKPISRTPYWWNAGNFLITNWPGGKHCLTSVGAGVSQTLTSDKVGATITSADQPCIPITLVEVPCDIRTWCSKTQTSKSASADKPVVMNAEL